MRLRCCHSRKKAHNQLCVGCALFLCRKLSFFPRCRGPPFPSFAIFFKMTEWRKQHREKCEEKFFEKFFKKLAKTAHFKRSI